MNNPNPGCEHEAVRTCLGPVRDDPRRHRGWPCVEYDDPIIHCHSVAWPIKGLPNGPSTEDVCAVPVTLPEERPQPAAGQELAQVGIGREESL